MYICVCKAVTDSQLETAINKGMCTRKQLYQCFGVGGDCGKCNKDIHKMLHCRNSKQLVNVNLPIAPRHSTADPQPKQERPSQRRCQLG